MKRLSALLLSLLMLLPLSACGSDEVTNAVIDVVTDVVIDSLEGSSHTTAPDNFQYLPEATNDYIFVTVPGEESTSFTPPVEEGEYYYDLESVVLYLEYYGDLPDNYITKNEARSLGWEGGTPERYLEGSAIGGDSFGNREGLLPKGKYTECDLNTLGKGSRGAERLVFSAEEYYYTEDHYESFTQVWVENGEVIYE